MIYFLSKEFGQNVKDIWGTEEEDCKTNAQDQFGDFHFGFLSFWVRFWGDFRPKGENQRDKSEREYLEIPAALALRGLYPSSYLIAFEGQMDLRFSMNMGPCFAFGPER